MQDKSAPPPALDAALAPPIPPRYWWLKRIALAAALFVLALVGVRLWWGYIAETRLQAKIGAYHAAGEPILLEDLATQPIPDEENGAYFLQQAAAQLGPPVEVSDVIRDSRTGKVDLAAARKFLADNAQALRLVHEAQSRAATDWQVRLRSPVVITFTTPSLAPQRALAKTTCSAAYYAHALNHDEAALEAIRDNLALSRHVDRMEAGLISDLTAVAIDELGLQVVETIAHNLAVGDNGSPESRDAQSATCEQVRSLIRELLDEADSRASWRRALRYERMQELDAVTACCEGRLSLGGLVTARTSPLQQIAGRTVTLLLAPAFRLDALHMTERADAIGRSGDAPNWPTALRQLPPDLTARSVAEQVTQFLSTRLIFSASRAVLIHFWLYADRRMAAIALAMRLYEFDHGQRPATLVELVPDYLPAMPLDPFDPNDGPIRYLPDAPSPLLYSIGSNAVDDEGAVVFKSAGFIDRDAGDLPFYLNGDRPLPPPDQTASPPNTQPTSTQAVVNDEQVESTQEGDSQQNQ
jgi:hypothetical protein